MNNLSQNVPCIRASDCSVMHIHTPREHLDGGVQIERKSDGFDPSGQGENHAEAVKEDNQIKRVPHRALLANCCTTSALQSRAASTVVIEHALKDGRRHKPTYTLTALHRRHPCRRQRWHRSYTPTRPGRHRACRARQPFQAGSRR